ncbi:TonB family protein [candidate division KSB1 bacterium]|nr:TonB family protein [candidate division KSB1 bacterium]
MKKAVVVFILIILSNVNAQNRVEVREVNIETEFYDVLNKTRLEFILINETGRNNLEGNIHFNINKSAIITDMWLEIDGELKRAETLARLTGQKIYDRITRRHIDPALLTKISNGAYYLRVFPVNSNQIRRVIIEYYSILETDDNYFPEWTFDKLNTKVNITITCALPESSYVYINGIYANIHTKNKFSLTTPTRIQFNFFKEKKPVRFYKNDFVLWQTTKETKEFVKIINSGDIPSYLELVIEHIKNKDIFFIEKEDTNIFLNSFIRYLVLKYHIPTFYHDEAWNWAYYKGHLTYFDQYIMLYSQKPSHANYQDLYCPYLNIFYNYLFGLNKKIDEQKDLGFLTLDLSKIVLEENKRALQIRESELKQEEERIKQSMSPGMEPDFQPDPYDSEMELMDYIFIAYDSSPQPVGGFRAIQKNLNYHSFTARKDLQGRVVVNCLIDENGQVARTKILKSLHPVLDLLAVNAIKSVEWKPATQRNKPVKVWIGIPVVFINDDIDNSQIESDDNKIVKISGRILNRDFDIELTEQNFFYEVGFDRANNNKVIVNSEPSFDILFDYPELIKYVYEIIYIYKVKGLGLLHNGQSIYFESE